MILTKRQLIRENEQLHSRLFEFEEALIAIRNGEVDAIMVSGSNGEQVYSLSSAETPYRTFIEEMSEGAITLTKDGTILYCNPKFTEIVKKPYEKIVGSTLRDFINPIDQIKLDNFLIQSNHKKHDVLIVSLNETLFLRLSIHTLPPYLQGDNYILIATDISDLKKKEYELNNLISNLIKIINGLRALRIDNINQALDVKGEKSKLEISNAKLINEIESLKLLIEDLKKKKKEQEYEINLYLNFFQ